MSKNLYYNYDDAFVNKLKKLEGSNFEFTFNRRGSGDSNYDFHGTVVSVDEVRGTIEIARTRSHEGEIHVMNISNILNVTYPSGTKLINKVATEQDNQFRKKQDARVLSVLNVKKDPYKAPLTDAKRSSFFKLERLSFDGEIYEGYLYRDFDTFKRMVLVIGKSKTLVDRFMSMQDIFLTLDEMLLYAIEAHVLWPRGIEYCRLNNPQCWSLPWRDIYFALDGLHRDVLKKYLNSIRKNDQTLNGYRVYDRATARMMEKRGLLEFLDGATPIVELVELLQPKQLRAILQDAGIEALDEKRKALANRVLSCMTPELEEAVRDSFPRKMKVTPPCGIDIEKFHQGIEEQRTIIFIMRQWLLGTDRLEDFEEEFYLQIGS